MTKGDLLKVKKLFKERLDSLDNDAKRAYYPIEEIGFAPFPIAMYAFATVDYFSSFWAGWNDKDNRPDNDKRSQTRRISDFLETYCDYPQRESQIAITIWRHKLMHTGEPRLLKESNFFYGWLIAPKTGKHWELENTNKNEFILHVGIFDLIGDLKNAVFGPDGYFYDLRKDDNLQKNWKQFEEELSSYTFEQQ